jgi:predicted membrane protein
MRVSHLSMATGGGNMAVVLPAHAANLSLAARTGGGNISVEIGGDTSGSNTIDATSGAGTVVVRLPSRLAAKVHATSGLGKVAVDPRLTQTTKAQTFETPDYDAAADRVEMTLHSGAGNVIVEWE